MAALWTMGAAAEVPERKPLVLDTVLVQGGGARAVIVSPDAPEYRGLAERVQSALKEVSGAVLPIVRDGDVASARGEIKGAEPDRNIILLGNQEVSGLVTHLCQRGYSSVDTQYPGRGGYVVRTVHDPWGTGANVITLLGSDLRGVERAAARFCAGLPRGANIAIPRTAIIQLSAEMRKTSPYLLEDLSEQQIKERMEKVRADFEAGVQGGVFNPITYAGSSYLLGGKEGYARLFRELVFLAAELAREGQGPFGGPWGAAADFLFNPLMIAWDNVEESTSLSDDDRRRIVEIILDYIHYWEEHGYTRGMATPLIRNNHYTFEGQGFLVAGQYFAKYYKHPEAQKWLDLADGCFRTQMKSFMPQEDCGGYQWITARHICRYSTTRPDFSWFDSGKAKILGDLAIMETDNLGYHCSFGDVGGFAPMSVTGVLPYYISVTRDGRYVWLLRKLRKAVGYPEETGLANSTQAVEPVEMLGVRWIPTDPLFYSCWIGKGKIPQEKTFEKVTFRTSFDPGQPYMILDGLNGCYHGHYDGNSILRFTDRGRIWLADADYIKSLPKFHNTMLVLKDGEAAVPQVFCEKELVADLGHVGMSRSTTRDYNGTDWTRSIIWDKGRTFVFVDQVRAQTTDEYSLRCHWHALGVPELQGNLFRVTQKGPSFSIRNLDGARLRRFDDPVIGANWNGYKDADPIVRTLQQTRTQRLPGGGTVTFLNVLTTEGKGETPVPAYRASDSSVLIGDGEDRALVGVRSGAEEILPGIVTDAQVYRVSKSRIALGGVTRLSIGGREIPIQSGTDSIELPVPSGFQVHLPRPAPVGRVSAGGAAGLRALSVAAEFSPDKDVKLISLATDTSSIYAGASGGTVYALGTDGSRKWTFSAGSEVRAIWTGKLDRDAPPRIAVGTANSMVYLLDEHGNVLWKTELPYFKRAASLVYFTSADLDGSGNRALIAGAENWHHYAFDASGKQLWKFEGLHASTAGAAVDLDGDGRQEVITGTEYYSWRAVKPNGEMLWQYKPVGPRTNSVVAGDVSGDGKPTVLFGGADGYIHALDPMGKRRWLHSTGDEVTSLALLDVNGDGVQDIVSGSLSFNVTAVKGDGTRLWRRDLGEPVLAVVTADLDGDGVEEICAGTEDGHVFALGLDGKVTASWSAGGPVRRLGVIAGSPDRLAALTPGGQLVMLGLRRPAAL